MRQRRSRSAIALFAIPIATALVIGLGALRIPTVAPDDALTMSADLTTRKLTVMRGGEVIKEYDVAVGKPEYPTPRGTFSVQKIVWNPKWVPPDSKWARGKKPAAPGSERNPMKLVKIFFQEPDYYIHGTGDTDSLGDAASHGCLRMDPDEAGELALLLMENSGVFRDWDWVKGILHLGSERAVTLATPATLTISG
jgi:lipoprotein-anchoring transpeptidase ErfK/SrfK